MAGASLVLRHVNYTLRPFHSLWLYTMHRCAFGAAAIIAALPAFAQQRHFPANALRGEIVIVQPPEIRLNGQPSRLAPGARIHDALNAMQLSGSLVGQRLVVHYTRDHMGQPQEVWVLTAEEQAVRPWPVNDQQAAAWLFDAGAQRWTAR